LTHTYDRADLSRRDLCSAGAAAAEGQRAVAAEARVTELQAALAASAEERSSLQVQLDDARRAADARHETTTPMRCEIDANRDPFSNTYICELLHRE
jgi:hypothetical protein